MKRFTLNFCLTTKDERKKKGGGRYSSYVPQFVNSLHICTTVNAFKIVSHILLMAIAHFQSVIYNIRQWNRFLVAELKEVL